MKMKNKLPPDNTGKKYLTELTAKQRKFTDLYCSKYGELSASDCARLAGYEADSSHSRATELLDWIDIAFLQAPTASLNFPNSFNTAPRFAYATSLLGLIWIIFSNRFFAAL